MTLLQIMPDDAPDTVLLRTQDEDTIAQALRERSVSFTRWPLRAQVTPQTASEELLDAYRAEIDELCARQELRLVDVARLHPEEGAEWQERAAKARSTFLDEHRHAEDEVRFFAHGTGCFYLHLEDRVYAVVCEAGDLLSVPAGDSALVRHGTGTGLLRHPVLREGGRLGGRLHPGARRRWLPRLDALLREG